MTGGCAWERSHAQGGGSVSHRSPWSQAPPFPALPAVTPSDVRRRKKRIKQVRRPRSWKVSYGDVFTASPYCLLTRCYGANPIIQSWFGRLIHNLASLQHKCIHTCPLHLNCSHAMLNLPSFRSRFRFRFRDSQEHLWTECPVLLWKLLICFQQVVDSRRMAAGSFEPTMGELGLDHGGLEAVRGSELNVSAWEQGHMMLPVSVGLNNRKESQTISNNDPRVKGDVKWSVL